MHKMPYYKDCKNPPGQIVNEEYKLLAVSALSTPKAKTLSEVLNRVIRQTQEEKREEERKAVEAEAYTKGYYDGVLEERHKWINNTYHQD